MDSLEEIALQSYDRMIGLEKLSDVSVDGCITKAPCGGDKSGTSPVDRGKRGIKRSTMVDANGIPLAVVAAGANRHDWPLLSPTLDAAYGQGGCRVARAGRRPPRSGLRLEEDPPASLLEERGLVGVIAKKGVPAPLVAGLRWVVERTNSWQAKLAHKKLVWCTEREDRVIDFWIALSNVVIVVRRLIREGWVRYRWEGRPSRKP